MVCLMFSSQAEWMNDIYYPPWCRAGPYFIGILLGFILFRVNGKMKIHVVSASLFTSVRMLISFVVFQYKLKCAEWSKTGR